MKFTGQKALRLLIFTLTILLISSSPMAGLPKAVESAGANGSHTVDDSLVGTSLFSINLAVQRVSSTRLRLTAGSSENNTRYRFEVREMDSGGGYNMIRDYSLDSEFIWEGAREGAIYEIVAHGISNQGTYTGSYVVFGNTNPSSYVPFRGVSMQVYSEGNKVHVTAVPQGGTNVIYALQYRKGGGQYSPLDSSNPYQASPNMVRQLDYGQYEMVVHAIDMAGGAMTYYGAYTPFNHAAPNPQLPLNIIVRPTTTTVQKAQQWAASKQAHQRFIDIAPLYWHYGNLTGINPEILYVQSAHETAYGHYTGIVSPEQNNWAGIKTRYATGDTPADHETFASPEDGVRGHFNHMSAYVGLPPIGVPHGRYHTVMSLTWAGTITTVEEMGARWAVHSIYAERVMQLLNDLLAY
ncbi:glucosaminidase domain-containing protein [Candidatus Contubernalis alkaliaceticus]|uniref:glucosaminidase domain-containing protein n=1 Tax=Candidatus Contubernalis alkaliaceticus TaxID=338645 RepID=UPI001F4BE57D|nr:glucosaminidase domain-containing protein [Candidatus Contubernalis alkalaceticus]UNC93600.1 glucosaminidase domain-containing protein [Candidatus Contubernalis alkalaceticus]